MLGRLAGGYRLDTVGPGQGQVAGSCEYGDEPAGSGATELVSYAFRNLFFFPEKTALTGSN
jgi:hypothetical protein